jgi:methyl-accepting chemotaxis protein
MNFPLAYADRNKRKNREYLDEEGFNNFALFLKQHKIKKKDLAAINRISCPTISVYFRKKQILISIAESTMRYVENIFLKNLILDIKKNFEEIDSEAKQVNQILTKISVLINNSNSRLMDLYTMSTNVTY